MSPAPTSLRILIVGDVHGHWCEEDTLYLEQPSQDLALFVGDLGDEDVDIVREISELRVPKAVILGNHDAWQSFSRKCPTDQLRESVALLGGDHIGYARRELPDAGVTLIGARPFSWGGRDIRSPEVYREFYRLGTMRQSAQRIVELAAEAEHEDIVILAHNGPLGLSSEPEDIWGKDFGRRPGGDWGDQDLAWAIDRMIGMGVRIRAVIAGHMHDRLTGHAGVRTRFVRAGGIDYLNSAVVPRIRRLKDGAVVRHFLRTEWGGGHMLSAEEIWVDSQGQTRVTQAVEFAEVPVRSA